MKHNTLAADNILNFQDPLPVVPPGCSSEHPATIQEFIIKAKAALVSVGIIRDSILSKWIEIIILSLLFNKK